MMKDIPGFEGKYAVTEDGRIWSHPRVWKAGMGGLRSHNGKFLKPILDSSGYHQVSLCDGTSYKSYLIHKLVALAFIQNPQGFPQINHINGCRTDNKASNIEWCTASDNLRHAYRLGLRKPSGVPNCFYPGDSGQ